MQIENIYIYPIKSCKGIPLTRAEAQARGLACDRRWMLVNEEGLFLTQRKYPKMALISVAVNQETEELKVEAPGHETMVIDDQRDRLEETITASIWKDNTPAYLFQPSVNEWFSKVLGQPVRLVKQSDALRQVDTDYSELGQDVSFADGFPYLLTNTSSLEDLNKRLENPVSMSRFRPNLVLTHPQAFIEDTWKSLTVGDVGFAVKKPCARCVLTTVDPKTGLRDEKREPLNTLAGFRTQAGGVMFGQNLVVSQPGWIAVGDKVNFI